jgi:hypothetical protein
MKSLRFACDDRYEAEKLASLMSVQKDGSVYVDSVAAIIDNEIVIKLKDKSSHAVVLKDNENVKALDELLQEVASGKTMIISSNFEGSMAEIDVR